MNSELTANSKWETLSDHYKELLKSADFLCGKISVYHIDKDALNKLTELGFMVKEEKSFSLTEAGWNLLPNRKGWGY